MTEMNDDKSKYLAVALLMFVIVALALAAECGSQ
jgi:hypothetical protein